MHTHAHLRQKILVIKQEMGMEVSEVVLIRGKLLFSCEEIIPT